MEHRDIGGQALTFRRQGATAPQGDDGDGQEAVLHEIGETDGMDGFWR